VILAPFNIPDADTADHIENIEQYDNRHQSCQEVVEDPGYNQQGDDDLGSVIQELLREERHIHIHYKQIKELHYMICLEEICLTATTSAINSVNKCRLRVRTAW